MPFCWALCYFAKHYVVLLSTTPSCWALCIFEYAYRWAPRHLAEHYEVYQLFIDFIRINQVNLGLVRNSCDYSARPEILIWLSARTEKSPEFRSGPKVRAENSVGRNSCNPWLTFSILWQVSMGLWVPRNGKPHRGAGWTPSNADFISKYIEFLSVYIVS